MKEAIDPYQDASLTASVSSTRTPPQDPALPHQRKLLGAPRRNVALAFPTRHSWGRIWGFVLWVFGCYGSYERRKLVKRWG